MYVVYVIIIYVIYVTAVQVTKHTNNPKHKVLQHFQLLGQAGYMSPVKAVNRYSFSPSCFLSRNSACNFSVCR